MFGVYLVFAFLTWTAQPLFNVLLRVDPIGRYALSRRQIVASNWVGSAFLMGIATVLTSLLLRQTDAAYGFATGYGLLTAFTAAAFSGSTIGTRRVIGSLVALLGVFMAGATITAAFSSALWLGLSASAAIAGLLAFNLTAQLRRR